MFNTWIYLATTSNQLMLERFSVPSFKRIKTCKDRDVVTNAGASLSLVDRVEVDDENDVAGDDLSNEEEVPLEWGGSLRSFLWGAIYDGEDEEYINAAQNFSHEALSNISPDEDGDDDCDAALIRPPVNDNDFYSQPSTTDISDKFYKQTDYVSDIEARESLIYLVNNTPCYGRSAARHLDIYETTTFNTLIYSLDTFTETRSTCWEKVPHKGTHLESSGSIPEPWHVYCHPTRMFKDETKQLEVPHTAFITDCQNCSSSGWTKCRLCLGRGHMRCVNCAGTGRLCRIDVHDQRHLETCWHCHGTGRKKFANNILYLRCSTCTGDGKNVCSLCQGHKSVKTFTNLRVEYKNIYTDHVILPTNFPEDLIKRAHGDIIIDEIQPRVKPIVDYNQDELCVTSQTFHQQHIIESRNSRIIMQRQRLMLVPLLECSYTWLETCGKFWVYGKDRQVYAPDYPQQHCWGCFIL